MLLLLIIRSRPFVGAGKCLASCLHRDYGPHRSARSGHALPYAGNGVIGAGVISEYPHADRLRVLRVTCTVPCRVVTWPLRRLPLAQPRTLRRFVDTPLRPGSRLTMHPGITAENVPGQFLPWPDQRSPVHSPAVPFIKATLPTPTWSTVISSPSTTSMSSFQQHTKDPSSCPSTTTTTTITSSR